MSDDENDDFNAGGHYEETFKDRERLEKLGICGSLGVGFDQKSRNLDPRQRRLGEACIILTTDPRWVGSVKNIIKIIEERDNLESLNMALLVAAVDFVHNQKLVSLPLLIEISYP